VKLLLSSPDTSPTLSGGELLDVLVTFGSCRLAMEHHWVSDGSGRRHRIMVIMESRRNGPQLSSRHDDDDDLYLLLANDNNRNRNANRTSLLWTGQKQTQQLTGPRNPSSPVRTNDVSPRGRPSLWTGFTCTAQLIIIIIAMTMFMVLSS